MNEESEDRVVVITGAAGGIGAATARRFAAAGARLVLADRDGARLEAVQAGLEAGSVFLVTADLTRPEAVRELAEQALAAFGRADVLVNGVGLLRTTPLEEISPEEWDEHLRVNLTAVFLCCQAFLPAMRAQRYGDEPAGGRELSCMACSSSRCRSTAGGHAPSPDERGEQESRATEANRRTEWYPF